MEIYHDFSHALRAVFAGATIVFFVSTYLSKIKFQRKLSQIPLVALQRNGTNEEKRQSYLSSAKALYTQGYEKFKNGLYRVTNYDGVDSVVFSTKFLPELRRYPDDVLNAGKAMADFFEAKYTHVIAEEDIVPHTIKAELTPALARLNPVISETADKAINDEMPECADWTSIRIFERLLRIVAKISGRVFVGPELCEDERYLDASVHYTMELVAAQRRVKSLRPLFRPIFANLTPEIRQLRKREKMTADFLLPVVEARLEGKKRKDWQEPDDMLQYWLNRREEDRTQSIDRLTQLELGLIFTAMYTTTVTVTNVFFSLAATPEYIGPIREEIREVLAANEGVMSSKALQEMEKLDSYVKEVFRLHPIMFVSSRRRVLKGITLSNGQYIPPGLDLELPSYAIYRDSEFYPDGDTFDGFRAYKLRQGASPEENARNQFVNVGESNPGFGFGRNACPGRYFANNEIKMVTARMLLKYDVNMIDGMTTRWENIGVGSEFVPDASKEILIKRIM
ncbi:cytochrome P450 [Biscogniauxia marginata]|nr:cytochrome P450 [Biscogniauxia marginata]